MSQSSASNSAIESAVRVQTGLFWAYVIILMLGAVLTVLLFRAGNKVQEAIKADADARIRGSDERIKQVESDAQVKIKQIEDDAETAKRESDRKIAELNAMAQSAVSDAAKARQDTAKLELEIATQRERAAKAEKDLLELQQRIRPRQITADQRTGLIALLSQPPRGTVEIVCVLGDGEGFAFAAQINEVLQTAGWTVAGGGVEQAAYSGSNPVGLEIVVRSAVTAPPFAAALQQAFNAVGLPMGGIERADRPEGSVQILVGNKP